MADNNAAKPWSTAVHDTIPAVDLSLYPPEAQAYLLAFLQASGEEFVPPYSAVTDEIGRVVTEMEARQRQRKAPRADITPQRVRTWKAVFEKFGFLLVDDASRTIQLTPLGRAVKGLHQDLAREVDGANDRLAWLAVRVLSRHRLRNPLSAGDYPLDADLHPYRFIWKAMRKLDDKIHWEEMNRVLMKVDYQRDEEAAIAHVRDVRASSSGVYSKAALAKLGTPVVDEGDETKRRITPWLTQAGFGGLLITPEDDDDGYRFIAERYRPLIDDAIDRNVQVPESALASPAGYLKYLTELEGVSGESPSPGDEIVIQAVVSTAKRFGTTKIVALSGLPGTGKTRLAKLVASHMTDGDPYRFMEIQFHEGTSYDDFIEGFVPRPSGSGFELVDKSFRIINQRAAGDPAKSTYVLLIEEFTRANLHAVLGELLTYVEHRARPFRFTYSQDEDSVAPNLLILATFNPRDKSAIVLDDAIVRRLHQIPVAPSVEALRSMLQGGLAPDLLDRLSDWFSGHIASLPFGHGGFAGARTADDLRDMWRGSLRYFLLDRAGQVRDVYKELSESYPWQ